MESMKNTFIENQKVDADAAYERLSITRKTLKNFKRAINDTNTVDVAGELKLLYMQAENTLLQICTHEELLISQGE